MAVYREDIVDIELQGGNVFRSFLNHALGAADNAGNRFGFRLKNNGEPVSLTGAACIGYFIRPDGTTLVINGATSNGVAYVTLPEAAYSYEGNFSLAIKLGGTGFAGTMRIVDGTIVRTSTGAISDPSSEVPSLEDLMEVIGRAEAAAADINALSITATQITGTRYKIAVAITT